MWAAIGGTGSRQTYAAALVPDPRHNRAAIGLFRVSGSGTLTVRLAVRHPAQATRDTFGRLAAASASEQSYVVSTSTEGAWATWTIPPGLDSLDADVLDSIGTTVWVGWLTTWQE